MGKYGRMVEEKLKKKYRLLIGKTGRSTGMTMKTNSIPRQMKLILSA